MKKHRAEETTLRRFFRVSPFASLAHHVLHRDLQTKLSSDHRVPLILFLSALGVISSLIYALIYWRLQMPNAMIGSCVSLLFSVLTLILLAKSRKIALAGTALIFGVYIAVLTVCLATGSLESPVIIWMSMLVVCGAIVDSKRGAVMWGVIGFLSLAALAIGDEMGVLPPTELHSAYAKSFSLIVNLGALLCLGIIIYTYEATHHAITGRLKESKDQAEDVIAELRETKSRLEQFNYIACHDLQEPLRTITNFTELIQKNNGFNVNSPTGKYISIISQSSERMRNLVADILEYVQLDQERSIEQLDVKSLIVEIQDDLQGMVEESGAKIELDDLPEVVGNKLQLKLLFKNLISNGLKFRNEDVAPLIRIRASKDKKMATFSVTDNGIGMESKHLDRVFDLFHRLHLQDQY